MVNESLYVFISFDLVNSTNYKNNHQGKWAELFNDFYTQLNTTFTSNIFWADSDSQLNIWKYVGDEVLFYVLIRDQKTLYTLLDHVSETLKSLEVNTFYEKYQKEGISVKAAVWAASVVNGKISLESQTQSYRNIRIDTTDYSAHKSMDFIGSEIDTGFRISKYIIKRNIVVSAELAYVLSRMHALEDKEHISSALKIVGFKNLKGVWENRAYPIIWYIKDLQETKKELDYDAHIDNDLVNNLKFNLTQNINDLKQVFDAVEKTSIAEHLLKLLENASCVPIIVENKTKEYPELHVVAVVVFKNNDSIFMAKRINRSLLNSVFEFGCAKLWSNETFENSIKNVYKSKFNIDITYIDTDNVIHTYVIEKSNASRNQGIIFYAEAESNDCVRINNPNKHSEMRFITSSEMTDIEAEIASQTIVSDAALCMKKAFSIYEKRKKLGFSN